MTIIASECIVSCTNQRRFKKLKCTSKNKSFELIITFVSLGPLDTNPLKNKRVQSCKNSVLKKKKRLKKVQ